jgi:outer membrane usher protein FimD/PapC
MTVRRRFSRIREVAKSQYQNQSIKISVSKSQYQNHNIKITVSKSQYQNLSTKITISKSQYQNHRINITILKFQYQNHSIKITVSTSQYKNSQHRIEEVCYFITHYILRKFQNESKFYLQICLGGDSRHAEKIYQYFLNYEISPLCILICWTHYM